MQREGEDLQQPATQLEDFSKIVQVRLSEARQVFLLGPLVAPVKTEVVQRQLVIGAFLPVTRDFVPDVEGLREVAGVLSVDFGIAVLAVEGAETAEAL